MSNLSWQSMRLFPAGIASMSGLTMPTLVCLLPVGIEFVDCVLTVTVASAAD